MYIYIFFNGSQRPPPLNPAMIIIDHMYLCYFNQKTAYKQNEKNIPAPLPVALVFISVIRNWLKIATLPSPYFKNHNLAIK